MSRVSILTDSPVSLFLQDKGGDLEMTLQKNTENLPYIRAMVTDGAGGGSRVPRPLRNLLRLLYAAAKRFTQDQEYTCQSMEGEYLVGKNSLVIAPGVHLALVDDRFKPGDVVYLSFHAVRVHEDALTVLDRHPEAGDVLLYGGRRREVQSLTPGGSKPQVVTFTDGSSDVLRSGMAYVSRADGGALTLQGNRDELQERLSRPENVV